MDHLMTLFTRSIAVAAAVSLAVPALLASTLASPAAATPSLRYQAAPPTISKIAISSPTEVKATITASVAGASLQIRTMSTGGDWSSWTSYPTAGVISVPIDVSVGGWIEAVAEGSDFFTYATKSYVRVDNNPATRGDVKAACRLVPVTAVGYANPSKPTVTLKSAPKCLKWRSSADDGKTYSKWKSVTRRTLTSKKLKALTMGRLQVKAGSKKLTVYVYEPETVPMA